MSEVEMKEALEDLLGHIMVDNCYSNIKMLKLLVSLVDFVWIAVETTETCCREWRAGHREHTRCKLGVFGMR